MKQAELPLTVFTTATLDRLHHLDALVSVRIPQPPPRQRSWKAPGTRNPRCPQCRALPGAAMSAAVYLPLVQRQGAALPKRNADAVLAAQKTLQVRATFPFPQTFLS